MYRTCITMPDLAAGVHNVFLLFHYRPVCKTYEFYKKMVAFVMAYSFTEPVPDDDDDDDDSDSDASRDAAAAAQRRANPPMMVPMADILNHVADNNAHLDFGPESLKMVAIKDIKKVHNV